MEVVLHLPVVPNVELVAAKAVETLGGALGMHQTRVEAASVAMVEACLNAMEHGGGPVVVRLKRENHESKPSLLIEVEDQGEGFDPKRAPQNSPSRVLGCASKRGWGPEMSNARRALCTMSTRAMLPVLPFTPVV